MPRFPRSVRVSAKWQTLHSIRNFAAQRINQHFLRGNASVKTHIFYLVLR